MSFSVFYLYKLRDEMSPALRKITGESKKMAGDVAKHANKISQGMEKSAKAMKSVGASMTVTGGAITAPLALATREAMKFNKGVAELSTLMPGKTLQETRDEFNDMLLGIAKDFGKSSDDVVKSAYQAVSAGVAPTRDAVEEFLKVSAKASIGGVTQMETAIDGITSVLNSYGADVISATEISDKMFTAVKLGKTTFDELSKYIYKVASPASALGVSFDDVAGALAVMTARGAPTRIAGTELQAILDELGKTGTQASDIFQRMANKSFRDFISEGGNLGDALEMLNQYAGKYNRTMKEVFSSSTAGAGALRLTGRNAEDYAKAINEAQKSTGAMIEATDKMMLDENFQFQQATANIKTTAIAIGTMLLPAVSKLFNMMASGLRYIQDFIQANPRLTQTILLITAGIGGFLTIGGTFLMMLGMMMSGVVALGKAIVGIKVALLVMKTAFIKTTAFLLANPLGMLVLGIAGIVGAIYLVWKHWEKVKTWIGKAVGWLWQTFNRWKNIIALIAVVAFPMLLPFIGLALLIRKHWDKVTFGFSWLWEKIKIIGAYWQEFFTPIVEYWGDAFEMAIDAIGNGLEWLWGWIMKIPDGLDWINNKVGKLFSILGLDKAFGLEVKPDDSMLKNLQTIQQSTVDKDVFGAVGFQGTAVDARQTIPEIESKSQTMDVNVKSDVGGILKIEIDNKGNVKTTGNKQNGNLGFQVGN